MVANIAISKCTPNANAKIALPVPYIKKQPMPRNPTAPYRHGQLRTEQIMNE
jgi:hypothetical protein